MPQIIEATFCGTGCREAFQCDREHGLIYPYWLVGGERIDHEEASVKFGVCAYCGREVV